MTPLWKFGTRSSLSGPFAADTHNAVRLYRAAERGQRYDNADGARALIQVHKTMQYFMSWMA